MTCIEEGWHMWDECRIFGDDGLVELGRPLTASIGWADVAFTGWEPLEPWTRIRIRRRDARFCRRRARRQSARMHVRRGGAERSTDRARVRVRVLAYGGWLDLV